MTGTAPLRFKKYFTNVYTSVTTTSSGNVLDSFDKYMTYYYNFDTMGYDEREAFRTAIQFEMLNSYCSCARTISTAIRIPVPFRI